MRIPLCFFTVAFFLLSTILAAQQCGITVDAGPDLLYCPGDGQVVLNGTVSGANVAGFSWSPTTGLTNPNSLNTLANVSGPTVYTLTAEVFDPTSNVIVNGDFESGDTGFTTEYNTASGGVFGLLSNEGEYMISTNSRLTHDNFAICPDHSGGGNMMVVNGSAIPDERVWCQMVTVVPGTMYSFNAWLMSAHPSNPARLQFSINGALLGSDFRASSTTCNWQQFSEIWDSGSNTSIEICITNQNTQPSGNDFAIDDIFFGEICTQTDDVFIDEVFLEAFANTPVDLPCTGGTATLDGSGTTTGPAYFYEWTTNDGNIVSGGNTLFPTVNQEGTYVLTARYEEGVSFCTEQAFVVVNANNTVPTAMASIFLPLNCNAPFAVLVADGSTTGPEIDYAWTTTDGNILTTPFADQISIDQPGTYQLVVTNVNSDCSDQATVIVVGDLDPPVATIQPPDLLTCMTTSLTLNGSGSSTDGSFDVVWSTTDGNIVSGSNQFNPVIDQPGTYVLTLSNQGNGCMTTQSVTVTENIPTITATVEPNGSLDCNVTQLNLNATNSVAPAGSMYQWSTMDGNIVSGGNTAQPLIDAPGTYVLLLTDPASGCESTAFVSVLSTAARPDIALQSPPVFTCVRAQITLDATASSTGSHYTYTWSAANGGGIVADTNSLTPTVAGPGDYTLSIVNTTNGCRRDTTFSIGENIAPPVADAGASFTLSCSSPTDTLNGLGSSQGTNFIYRWTTTDGTLTGGTTTLRPEINNAGTYQLVVTDTLNGCTDTARVAVLQDNNAPVVTIAPPAELTCSQTTLMLDASGSANGPGLTTEWSTTDGNITGGTNTLTPTIDQPGTYLLTITDQANGCPNTRSITVAENIAPPVPDAGPALTLTCFDPTGRLAAIDPGPGFSVAWSGTGPVIDPNTTTPLVSASGRYYFTITDLNNGCVATDSVDVDANQTPPAVALNPGPDVLTCTDTSLLLNPGATAANGLSYAWSTANGNVTSPDTLPAISVDQPGNYSLLVTDTTNGCTSTASLSVSRDVTPPNVEILPPAILNCALTETTLSPGSSDVGALFTVAWATTDGLLLPGAGAAGAVAGQGGTYQLTITNTANGCVDSTAVAVAQDTVAPNPNIGIAPTLTCRDMTVQLDGRFSSTGPDFTYQWTTSNGSIANGSNTLRPTVSAAGNYLLTVTNQRNNCTGSAAVLVEQLDQPPVLTATEPETLTCSTTSVALLARRAGSGETFSISWATTDGNILSGGNGLSPTVDQPGTYSLTVINTDTECRTTLPVVVMQDIAPPIVDLGEDFDLGCEDVPVLLSSSVMGPAPYDYSWATTDGNILSGGSSGTPQIQGPGTYAVTVTSKRNGCPATAEITTTQSLLLGFEAGQRDPTCRQPLGRVEITNVDGGTAPFLYAVGGQIFTTATFADSLQPGRYAVVVQDANGCEVNSEVIIPNAPELDLYVDPRTVISLGDSYFINTRTNFADSSLAQITWSPAPDLDCADCLRPTATPTVSSVYTVNVVSTDGCAASGSVEIIVDVLREVYFPTAFSPTGDGINDRFLPFGNPARIARIQDFSIFDRWGESVFNNTDFQPNDPANGWDGMLNGRPLNPAVFVYTAVVEFVDGRVETFKGDVVLLR